MHLIEVVGENPLGIIPGQYLAEDVNAGEMLSVGWCKVLGPGLPFESFSAKEDYNGARIIFVRPGGFGDLLFLTPAFAEIKRRWPGAQIHVACYDRYRPVLEHNPDVAGFVRYPVSVEDWASFNGHVWLENLIENNPDARVLHAVDLVALWLGLEFDDKAMRYCLTDQERKSAEIEFPRVLDTRLRVGVQMTASGGCRVYPHMHDLARRLWRDSGHEVFLFASPGDIKSDEPAGIVNLSARGKTFRQSCAILSTCDVVVAPDSALAHVAGALNIPCVALYGPFPWKLRTAYAPKTFALQGMCPISPCFHHRPGVFPAEGPCVATGRCEALAAIPVDRVLREVEKRLDG